MNLTNDTPAFLLDTGPLSVLCGFPIGRTPYIHNILEHTAVTLADSVVGEIEAAHRGKIARTISPLLSSGAIKVTPTPNDLIILDTAYAKLLGKGERSTIKVALTNGLTPVIDDKDAFIVACRFGVQPLGFQDFVVRLVLEYSMPRQIATEIINTTSRQFPVAYLAHTLDKLSG